MIPAFIFCAAVLTFIPACNISKESSLKDLTKPHTAHYKCTEATLGGENILEKYDYIEMVLIDNEKTEFIYKQKDSKRRSVEGKYSFDGNSRELTADFGILGYNFAEPAKIGQGEITITKAFGGKQFFMKFKIK